MSDSPHFAPGVLCTTRKGRPVQHARVGCVSGDPTMRVAVTARHHCCEMMASYALEGIMDTILSDNEDGAWLREHVAFLVVPFADKDGVEQGDQGKNRKPRDHNRDYDGESVYAATAALRKLVPEWGGDRLHFAMDMHCPHIRGSSNEVVYFVGMADPALWANTQAFSTILEATNTGLLPYRKQDNLPYGQGWNVAKNYGAGMSCSRWAGTLPGIRFAASLEIPYANAGGVAVTQESAHAFGRALAHAIRRFLNESPPTSEP
ncbi:MAG: peptidase M14, partial [Lentisphaerae bacterium]|nr:peptidase M14 [Lentisphaerota bacterium]